MNNIFYLLFSLTLISVSLTATILATKTLIKREEEELRKNVR